MIQPINRNKKEFSAELYCTVCICVYGFQTGSLWQDCVELVGSSLDYDQDTWTNNWFNYNIHSDF